MLTLNGKAYDLKYDVKSTRWFKRVYGKTMLEVLQVSAEAGDADTLCHFFAAGMLHEDGTWNVDRAGRILEAHRAAGGRFIVIREGIIEALSDSGLIGPPEEKEEPAPGKDKTA